MDQLLTTDPAQAGPADPAGHGGRYAMESWSPVTPRPPDQDRPTGSTRSPERHWVRMDRGQARKVWLPRSAAVDAVMTCMRWTGLLYIPEMQVIDLATGEVVWRDRWPGAQDPSPGPRVLPVWVGTAEQCVRAVIRAEAAKARAAELADARRWLRLPELAGTTEIPGAGALKDVQPVQGSLW